MPTQDIIDNRNERRIAHINQMFGKNERGRIDRMVQELYGMTFEKITLAESTASMGEKWTL
jgi:hypothetical protein